MATPEPTVIDPFDAATNAKAPSAEYFGEIVLDAWSCVLEKGVGKRPFDAMSDDPSRRSTAVDIFILPIADANVRFNIERKLIAESKAWTNITWPSLQKLGLVNAREAKGRYCKVKLAPTGRTWDKKDQSGTLTGEKGEETTFEFLELFADEAACIAAYHGRNGVAPVAPVAPAAAVASSDPAEDPAKKTALTFAKAIVTNLARAEKDMFILQGKIAEKIAAMPMISQFYTADSPEIVQLIAEALA
jgi:hypothetical protein